MIDLVYKTAVENEAFGMLCKWIDDQHISFIPITAKLIDHVVYYKKHESGVPTYGICMDKDSFNTFLEEKYFEEAVDFMDLCYDIWFMGIHQIYSVKFDIHSELADLKADEMIKMAIKSRGNG